MGVAINTAGVTVGYAVEAAAGTRPTSGYTVIPDIKSVPELNPSPETLESTDLMETEYKTYIEGLKDLGGALAFTANLTEELITVWDALIGKYEEAAKTGKSTWFEIKHPKLAKSVYFSGQPSKTGLPAIEVNSILETNLYITPTGAPEWGVKSTDSK